MKILLVAFLITFSDLSASWSSPDTHVEDNLPVNLKQLRVSELSKLSCDKVNFRKRFV